jgi:hypothetical protein
MGGLWTAIVDGVGNLVGWALIASAGSIIFLIRQTIRNQRRIDDLEEETEIRQDPTRLEDHERRMSKQRQDIADLKQYFTGDPNDPSNPGLLSEIHDIKSRLEDDQ